MNDQTTTRARDGRHRISTRALLACAAIGAAGGLVVAPITVFSSSGPALALPLIYALLRFPGAALLTGVIVGLINIPFSAHGPMVFVSLAGIGLLQEIVPAALLYRRWGIGVLLAGSVVAGAVLGLLGWRALASSATDLTVAIGYWAVCAVAAVAVTFIGFWIGERVRRSGVVAAAS
jgi:energy-coupling factor transport system substrate-specific component